MTAQAQEGLRFRGKEHWMAACPLEGAFGPDRPRPPFVAPHTACWRGYVGHWEVRDDRLYLVRLHGYVEGRSSDPHSQTLGVTDVFPEATPDGVFAGWCTDWLRVPDGEVVNYVHMGFGSEYERDLFLGVHGGQLVAVRTADNQAQTESVELTPRLDEVFTEEAPFIRAALANPADDLPKLVYADWLEERGDSRGELLRIDVDLTRAERSERRKAKLNAARSVVLKTVKDQFWMKLLGCPLP